jgi:hypothetical protein
MNRYWLQQMIQGEWELKNRVDNQKRGIFDALAMIPREEATNCIVVCPTGNSLALTYYDCCVGLHSHDHC